MQLGARWRAGDPPHRSVPSELHAEIAAQEAAHPDAGSWTLTWLEGRPHCALDELVTVTLPGQASAGGSADEDDDWLN